jgi:type IV pilus secretin PilQ/predicted competence protein
MTRRSFVLSCVFTGMLLNLIATGCGPIGSSGASKATELEPLTSADSGSGEIKEEALAEQPLADSGSGEIDSSLLLASPAQTLLEPAAPGSLGINWENSQDLERFALAAGSQVSFETSELSAPARVVVDLQGVEASAGEAIEVPHSRFVNRIRVGKHPGKSRIVFDLAQDSGFSHDIQRTADGQIIIAFAASQDMLASSQNIMKPMSMESSSNPANIDAGTGMGEPAETSAAMESASGAKLIGLELAKEETGTGNQVVAEMESAGFFSLVKSAPSEYILTIEGASLSEVASQPIIAPADQGMIRSARAVQSGENVQVRIFAQPDAFLQASAQGDKIVVASNSELAGNMRAQVDPSQLPQAATTPKTPPAAKPVDAPAAPKTEVVTIEETIANEDASSPVKPVSDSTEEIKDDVDAPAASDTEATKDKDSVEEYNLEEDFGDLLEKQYSGRLISLDLQETEIDNALRIIAEVSNLNIIASDDVTGKVTLRLIDVPWDQALDVILKTNGLDKVQEGNVVRIAPVDKLRQEREALKQAQQAEEELEPLKVQYLRVSYAKAADLQPLVESVITERGSVTYDDRTNQLIVKDIGKGLKNVSKLVEKIDLRTPQVLVETQIVEASKNFVRELGAELGFYYLRTPETGNPTGYNFPNSVEIGGSALDASGQVIGAGRASSFPAGIQSSAVSMLFGSADGTKGLDLRLSQGEREGLVKVISKPSVAVTNNSPAVIKSVEKVRIRLPSGGTTIGIGDGANAGGGGTAAGAGGTGAAETFEVGIILNVTAQASPDYYVLMDIEAESSTLGSPNRGADEIPTEIERSATSSVLVSSGQTFAMGGIYKVSQQDQFNGVPFLKDIPILGQFFRNSSIITSDEELIFFITPRIVEGSFDDASMQTVS